MNTQQRKEITQELYNETLILLEGKGYAYSGKDDTLANFKRIAENTGLTKYQVWAVYANKHIDAVNNAIKYDPEAPKEKTEGMRGRILDIITYMTILECMLYEDK